MRRRGTIGVVGVSHHTAPIEVRERFAFSSEEGRALLHGVVGQRGVEEAVLLSTCNRTELYVHGRETVALEVALRVLEQRAARTAGSDMAPGHGAGCSPRTEGGTASDCLYRHEDRAATRHLFRVVTSLDSMVLGEAQIQGQVKEAYEESRRLDDPVSGPILSRLFETALRTGGRVRAETALGMGAASVPGAAVELAKKIFGSLEDRRALVLGAGDMSALTLECLLAEGARSVVVANRTMGRAKELVERTGGAAIRFEEIAARLPYTDVIATATSAPHAMLTEAMMREALPKGARRPLCIIDMALPRDVEPGVGDIGNVFLYDIDDLQQIVDDNVGRRRAQIPAAERIIDEAVADFWDWYQARDVVPIIRSLRGRAEAARAAEVERLLRRMPDLSPEQREAIENATRQLMNKVLHGPTVRLREAAADGGEPDVARAARYLFDLDDRNED